MAHVSPSQASTWLGCKRKWAYSRTRPRSSTPAAEAGSRCHTVAENWLQHCTAPDPSTAEGRCIIEGLPFLPHPRQTTIVVEHEWRHDFWGVTCTGRIDFLYGYDPGRIVVVGDHKTTGDLQWMMAPGHPDPTRDFWTDPQRIMYGHWAATFFEVEHVAAHWQYYQRDAKRPSRPLVLTEHRDALKERFARLYLDALRPIWNEYMAGPIDPNKYPRNLGHCNAYGKCPYRDECLVGVSPIDRAAGALVQITKKEQRS